MPPTSPWSQSSHLLSEENMSDAVRLALLIGGFTLIGISITAGAALISQWINGHFSVKCKITELWLGRKIDSYQRVLNLSSDFAIYPNHSKKIRAVRFI